jgi:hypothetical protein
MKLPQEDAFSHAAPGEQDAASAALQILCDGFHVGAEDFYDRTMDLPVVWIHVMSCGEISSDGVSIAQAILLKPKVA